MATVTLRTFLLFATWATMLAASSNARVHEHAQKILSSATVNGFVGGESHDSYVIHVRKGQTMRVRISWLGEQIDEAGDNHAEFWIGNSGCQGDAISLGTVSEGGKQWTGKMQQTRDYYICVVAYPSAHYTLRVRADKTSGLFASEQDNSHFRIPTRRVTSTY